MQAVARPFAVRVVAGHLRSFIAFVVGVAVWAGLSAGTAWPNLTCALTGWNAGAVTFMILVARLVLTREPEHMPAEAKAQEDGEWIIFSVMLLGSVFSFAALAGEFSGLKDLTPLDRTAHVALVAATLLLSWLLAHTLFALRYAHEYYEYDPSGALIRGLEFPSEDRPDYLDFLYFAVVIGMTFQVSDVQITSRAFRRLAMLHGLVSFLFNTVIVALTVNIAAGLLN